MEVKLSKMQKALYAEWEKEFRNALNSVHALVNEVLTTRLSLMALEMGVDLDTGEWRFDEANKMFVSKEKKDEPKLKIPSERKNKEGADASV